MTLGTPRFNVVAVSPRVVIAFSIILFAAVTANAAISTNGSPIQIVTLQSDANPTNFITEFKLSPLYVYRHALNGFAAPMSDALVRSLRSDSRVVAIEPDGITYGQDVFDMPTNQIIGGGIWRMGLTDFPVPQINGLDDRIDVNVAVMDTGVQDIPELNIVQKIGFIEGSDGDDNNGHGTSMAAVIGEFDADYGPVGVAPGARIWSVRVLGQANTGTWSAFLAGMDYVIAHSNEIEVANLSLAGLPTSLTEATAIRQSVSNAVNQGIVVVVAAGNFTSDIYGADGVFGTLDDILPAALPEVLTVSAMYQTNNTMEPYSDFSANVVTNNPVHSPGKAIDVCAPARWILSAHVFGTAATLNGTSIASAQVSGLVALYIALKGRAHNAQEVYAIRQAIIDAAQPQSQWGVTNTLDPDGSPEPLAMPSLSWVPPVKLTSSQKAAEGFRMSFDTVPGYIYSVQYRDLLASSNQWVTLKSTNGSGRLANVSVLDPAPNPSGRYYRLARRVQPASSGNLLTNGGFEKPHGAFWYGTDHQQFGNGATIAEGWVVSGGGNAGVISLAPDSTDWQRSQEGSQLCYIGDNLAATTISQSVGMLQAQTNYTLSFFQSPRVSASSADGKVVVLVQSAPQTFSNLFTVSFTTQQGWNRQSLTFTPTQTTSFTVALKSIAGFPAIVDNIRLEPSN